MRTEVKVRLKRAPRHDEDADWYLTVEDRRSGVEFLAVNLDNEALADFFAQRGSKTSLAEVSELAHVGRYQHHLSLIMPVDNDRAGNTAWTERQAARTLARWQNGNAEIAYDGTTGWEFHHVDKGDGRRKLAIFYRYSEDDPRILAIGETEEAERLP